MPQKLLCRESHSVFGDFGKKCFKWYGWPDVFIPEISAFVRFDPDGNIRFGTLVFSDIDCNGGFPYSDPFVLHENAYRLFKLDGVYYLGQKVAPQVIDVKSGYSESPGCYETSSPISPYFVPATTINEGDLPFTLPITLPFDIRVE